MLYKLLAITSLLLGISLFQGEERWAVKTTTDNISINQTPIPTTIAHLISITPPEITNTLPRQEQEKQVYSIHTTVIGFKYEDDQDFHIVISDNKNTMICEIPNPKFCKKSPLYKQILSTRKAFIKMFGTPKTYKTVNKTVTVTGVLFFDKIHGQTGVAKNGVELHPLIEIK